MVRQERKQNYLRGLKLIKKRYSIETTRLKTKKAILDILKDFFDKYPIASIEIYPDELTIEYYETDKPDLSKFNPSRRE